MGGGAQRPITPGAATKDAEKRKYSESVWSSYWQGVSEGKRNERPASAMKEFGDGDGKAPTDEFYIRDDETKDAYRQRLEGLGFKSVWQDIFATGDVPGAKTPDPKAAPDLTDALLKQKAAAEMDAQRMRRGRVSTFLGAGNTAAPTTKKTLLGG